MDFKVMTQKQLETRLKFWQKVLRLQDWSIAVSLVPSEDIEGAHGMCNYVTTRKAAVIRVMRHSDWKEGEMPYDADQTLVHELLHLHFALFAAEGDEDSLFNTVQEQAVDLIADALVLIYRRAA